MVQLERDQALIVVHANDGIVLAARGVMKQTIRRQWTFRGDAFASRHLYRRSDDLDLFSAENTLFTRMRVQRRHRYARSGDGEILFQALLGQLERGINSRGR